MSAFPPLEIDAPPCPACGGMGFRKLFTKKGRDFWKCTSCGLERQQPLPTLPELESYYEQSYDHGLYKEFLSATEVKRATAKRRFEEIHDVAHDGRWLDVGCANGVFVESLRERGIDAHGIDLSGAAVARGRARGLPIQQSAIEDYRPDTPFDVVTCFDLLEHAIDPLACLNAVHRLLAAGGKLVITLPNQGSVIRKLMGRRWYFYIPEEHLHFFNPTTIRRLLSRTGFETERCVKTFKPLSYRYSLAQFAEYNPSLHRTLQTLSKAIPRRLLDWVLPLYIGEMLVVASKRQSPRA